MASSTSPPPVVPRLCAAMAVALEVVAEHRRLRAEADLRDEAAIAANKGKTPRARGSKKRR